MKSVRTHVYEIISQQIFNLTNDGFPYMYITISFHYLSFIFISLRVSGINLYHVLLHLQHHHWLVFALQQVIWKTKIELWKFPMEISPLFYI